MAYVSKEKKAKIAAALKKVVPAGWKYSLAVRDHSEIIMTIYSAPVDLVGKCLIPHLRGGHYIDVNLHHLDSWYGGLLLAVFKDIKDALNIDNYDRSDISTDYFDVGHYVRLYIGRFDKPFKVVGA